MTRLLLIVLGIPLFALVVGITLPIKVRSDFAARVEALPQNRLTEDLAGKTLDAYCEQRESSRPTVFCRDLAMLQDLSISAVWVAFAGLLLLSLIHLGGRYAASDRAVLLRTFRPGLYLANLSLIGLIIANTTLAVFATHLAQEALFGGAIRAIAWGMVLSALAAVFTLVRASFAATRPTEIPTTAHAIRASEAPELWGFVRELAVRMNVDLPDNLLLTLEPDFFVTDAPVRSADDRFTGRTLVLSLSLSRLLTRDELAAIVGHELGHYKGFDLEYSRYFYPIYGRSVRAIEGLEANFNRDIRGVALLPAIAILSFFLETFAIAERRIGRERELAADLAGADLVGAHAAATALVKVHAFAGAWGVTEDEAVARLQRSEAFENLSMTFSSIAVASATPSILDGIDSARSAHPIDTHPPLSERMTNLGVRLDEVSELALVVGGEPSAIGLIPEPQRIERKLTQLRYDLYRALLSEPAADTSPSIENATR